MQIPYEAKATSHLRLKKPSDDNSWAFQTLQRHAGKPSPGGLALTVRNSVKASNGRCLFQYFRRKSFANGSPCEASELVHFRHRMGRRSRVDFKRSIR
ncbi:MAG: hypothetical protein IPP77_10230 [Bacteroidetes bacterium]|nr:hypothetical protein [Bacteroidota bacterium]